MKVDDTPLNDKDKIKAVNITDEGKVSNITLADDNKFSFDEFIELFKLHLKTMFAGEIISWDDYARFTNQISPRTFAEHLNVAESEGITAGLKYNWTPGRKISIVVIAVLAIIGVVVLIALKGQHII